MSRNFVFTHVKIHVQKRKEVVRGEVFFSIS
jgi:hypothetical protein